METDAVLGRIQTFYALVWPSDVLGLDRLQSQALLQSPPWEVVAFVVTSEARGCWVWALHGNGGGHLATSQSNLKPQSPNSCLMGAGRGSVQHTAQPDAEGAVGKGAPEKRAAFLAPFCFFLSLSSQSSELWG